MFLTFKQATVSQYTNNEFKVLTSFENQPTHVESFIEDFLKPQANNAVVDGISEDFDLGKPRLIRSNSYVLETPSPLLLEHLKRHTDNDINAYLTSVPTKEVFTSTPNDEVLDKLNTSKSDFFSETDSELKNISDNSTQEDITVLSKGIVAADNKEVNEQSADSISDDPISECLEKKDYSICLSSIQDLSLDPHDQDKLANILNAIPEAYSKQILELLDKQKQEQMIRLNSYMKIKETFLTVGDVPTIMDPLPTDKIQPEKSAYYTPESFMSPTTNENNNFTYHINIMNDNNIVNNPPKLISQKCEQFTVVEIPKSCTRRLFAYQKSKDQDEDKKNWAATIIQANIKGYLTRRLLKTVRVQGLIQTIKDALMCAMELHSENVDNINESDVELHRRLIQQVSAAVYAFYDVFFKTTISEKMVIIRTDRERIKEKLKRPRSKASSISSRTTRSSRLS